MSVDTTSIPLCRLVINNHVNLDSAILLTLAYLLYAVMVSDFFKFLCRHACGHVG